MVKLWRVCCAVIIIFVILSISNIFYIKVMAETVQKHLAINKTTYKVRDLGDSGKAYSTEYAFDLNVKIDDVIPSGEVTIPKDPVQVEPQPQPAPQPAPVPTPTPQPSTNAVIDTNNLFVPKIWSWENYKNSTSVPQNEVDLVNTKIVPVPKAIWLGGWSGNVFDAVTNTFNEAGSKTPIFILYNIPFRDAGGFSSGGAGSKEEYFSWVGSIQAAIGDKKAIVVLEPDALAHATSFPDALRKERVDTLATALDILAKSKNALVYVDASHPEWKSADEVKQLLTELGRNNFRGISINVSNYVDLQKDIDYGNAIGKPFIIDTSRNGQASANGQWCNPRNQGLGKLPFVGNGLMDAALWLKTPGESDGNCNGGPNAGSWWQDIALELIKNAKF